MGLKDRLTFRHKHFIDHEVGGQVLRFYPNRIGLLEDLASLSEPIWKGISTLLASDSGTVGMSEKHMTQGDTIIKESIMQAASAEVLTLRAKEREGAIKAIVDAVSNPRGRLTLGALLMDSLRDVFPYAARRSPAEIEEFLYGDREEGGYPGLDLPTTGEMVTGWIKANAKQFGAKGKQVVDQVRASLVGAASSSPLSASETPTEPGSSSKTPSSPPSPTASS